MPDSASHAGSGLYIGLMSGTSMDSIDAVLVDFNDHGVELVATASSELAPALRRELLALCSPGDNEIERMGAADRQLGRAFAATALHLLAENGISPHRVVAIGSHGQTIRHRPNQADSNFSLQIGDPNTIAELTGITTVADFRRRDIAANGQGAPLAPAFHQAVFGSPASNRAVVNIGGMANVSLLCNGADTVGFDTGPGNVLLDAWIQARRDLPFDRDGQWAAAGRNTPNLLEKLLRHPFLAQPIPKSTGREEFNANWLQVQLTGFDLAPEDVQATLVEFTATTIADAIDACAQSVDEVYVCGGGAHNKYLLSALATHLEPRRVATTAALGIAPEWVEGAAFAWLARQTLAGRPGNLPSVTGATKPVVLGAIYRAG